jgi:cytochrome b6-f complex iron-sulfur subunit
MTDAPVHPRLHRRSILAVAAGLVGVLAGCGTEPSDDPLAQASTPVQDPPSTPAAAGSSDAALPDGAPTEGAPTDGAPAAEPADGTGVAIAAVADLTVGGGAVVSTKGGPVLLVRTRDDTVSAYRAACPHAGVTVNAPSGGTVTCPAHGSRFKAGDGSRISGPATEGLARLRAKTTGGSVYLV